MYISAQEYVNKKDSEHLSFGEATTFAMSHVLSTYLI